MCFRLRGRNTQPFSEPCLYFINSPGTRARGMDIRAHRGVHGVFLSAVGTCSAASRCRSLGKCNFYICMQTEAEHLLTHSACRYLGDEVLISQVFVQVVFSSFHRCIRLQTIPMSVSSSFHRLSPLLNLVVHSNRFLFIRRNAPGQVNTIYEEPLAFKMPFVKGLFAFPPSLPPSLPPLSRRALAN